MSVKLEYTAIANCPPEQVWQVFQNLQRWPTWNRIVGRAQWIEGPPWEKGSRFVLDVSGSVSIQPVVVDVAAPHGVVWQAKSFGVSGHHAFTFDAQPDGSTRIRTWAEISGGLTMFLSAKAKQQVLAGVAEWVNGLKAEAEALAGPAPERNSG